MVGSKQFRIGAGLDLHVRTTIEGAFSSITTMVLRVGDEKAEIDPYFVYYENQQVKWSRMTLTTKYFWIVRPKKHAGDGLRRELDIVLNDKSTVRVRRTMLEGSLNYISVAVEGSVSDFEHAQGLLGEYHSGRALGRDGRYMTGDWNAFGMEWQVLKDEPKLFRDMNRKPQLPDERCRMPTHVIDREEVKALGKKTPELYFSAMSACAKAGTKLNDCMEDMLVAKDLKAAEAYMF